MISMIINWFCGFISGLIMSFCGYLYYKYKKNEINISNLDAKKFLFLTTVNTYLSYSYDSIITQIEAFLDKNLLSSSSNINKLIISEVNTKIKPIFSNINNITKHVDWYISYSNVHKSLPFIFTIGITENNGLQPIFNITVKNDDILSLDEFKDILHTLHEINMAYVIN